jgi:hypothetical protein
VRFSSDHQDLFVLSGDGTIRLVPAHPDRLFRMWRGFILRNLNGAMRDRYAPIESTPDSTQAGQSIIVAARQIETAVSGGGLQRSSGQRASPQTPARAVGPR